jgi:hypothetical protein
MRLLRNATMALPAVLVAVGLAVPVIVGGGGTRPPAPQSERAARYAGRTAREWHALAAASAEVGDLGRAMKYLKTAEKVEPGEQYSAELAGLRSARRAAAEAAVNRERMLGGEVAGLLQSDDGRVTSAHRTVVALPGESLWSLAVRLAAAWDDVAPSAISDDASHVYPAWDALTVLNGVRELDVGEPVLLPLSPDEQEAISRRNADDLASIRLAAAALDSGRVDRAELLRGRVTGGFAGATEEARSVDARLRQARSMELLAEARAILSAAPGIPRASAHDELVGSLTRARELLEKVEDLSGGGPSDELARVDDLLAEAELYRVNSDGTIEATKPAGVAYVDFARATVEWFIARRLEESGAEYPNRGMKSPDDIAWARYMVDASSLARGGGFERLLTDSGERVVTLPNPGPYFDR